MTALELAAKTYARYVVPLTLFAVIACAPIGWLAYSAAAPKDDLEAVRMLQLAWTIAGAAWIVQYLLVGAAAPAARGIAAGTPLSQLAALRAGLVGIVRAALPCLLGLIAIAIGGLALAVPGVALVVLLSMTGASERPGLVPPLTESVDVARRDLRRVGLTVGAVVLVNVLIAVVAYAVLIGALQLSAKPTPAELGAVRSMLRAVAIGVIAISPLSATAMAALHAHRR